MPKNTEHSRGAKYKGCVLIIIYGLKVKGDVEWVVAYHTIRCAIKYRSTLNTYLQKEANYNTEFKVILGSCSPVITGTT